MSATNFKPLGQCVLANVSTVASSVTVLSNQNVGSWLITNAGSQDVFFRLSTNAAVTASVPVTSGTSAPGQMINAGDTYIIGLPSADGNGVGAFSANVAVSAVTQSGTSQLFINPVQQF